MNLQNATALITGGTSGIGRGIAQALAAAGARVAITGRDEGRLRETAEALKALPIRADVTSEPDVLGTYREVLQAFGHPLRPEEVAHIVRAVLEMDDRGFTPELSIFATNPKD